MIGHLLNPSGEEQPVGMQIDKNGGSSDSIQLCSLNLVLNTLIAHKS